MASKFGVIAVALFVPESRSTHPRPVDLPGILLSSAGLLGLSESTFDRVCRRDDGPPAVRLSARRVGFRLFDALRLGDYAGMLARPAAEIAAWDDPATPVVHMDPWSPMFGLSD